MNVRLTRNMVLALTSLAHFVSAATVSDSLKTGEAYYFAGEFKKAISQFRISVERDLNNPEGYLWLGKSYELLADTKPPLFSARAHHKARLYFAEAVRLAPECIECRRELFNSLITADDLWSALQEARALVEATSRENPEYYEMRCLLAQAQDRSSSREERMTVFLYSPSQTFGRLALRPPKP